MILGKDIMNKEDMFERNDSKSDVKETNINHFAGEKFCQIESNEDFWIRRIKDLEAEFKDKILIIKDTSDQEDGYIVAWMPYDDMKKIKPSKRTMTDEHKEKVKEALAKARAEGKIRRGRPKKSES